ncbi:hypothetical protein GF351_04190 [Candidatus Woesearchaeota archaeon]|nr:hypothetical protein [Candidatus Woesearchaeota archaeon]
MPKKEVYMAVATLVGTVIGAGILGIPYVVAKAGLVTGIIDIVLIGLAVLCMNLFLGEVTLRTKGNHQLTGYATIYLGRWGRRLAAFAMIFGIYGALIAYLIKEGEFFQVLTGIGSPIVWSLMFFVAVSMLIYRGLKAVGNSELYMVGFVLVVVLLISVLSFGWIDTENLTGFYPARLFVPYGVVLFAFLGSAAIPELREELVLHREKMKKAIMIGSIIPMLVYILFATVVVGVTGAENITEEAIIGLGEVMGQNMLLFGTVFGMLTMATSFLALGLALKEMYMYDYHLKPFRSTLLTVMVPLLITIAITLVGITNAFFRVIDITGVVSGGLTGILAVLMLWKSKKVCERKPEFSIKRHRMVGLILIMVFVFGMIYKLGEILGLISL